MKMVLIAVLVQLIALPVFADDVEALDSAGQHIGWRRSIGINSYGAVCASGTLTLGTNTVVSVRLDAIGADELVTFDSGTFRVTRDN